MNETLRAKLVKLADEDGRVRAELSATGELFQGYNARMREVHEANADELQKILDEFGWPGTSLAGEDGAEAAWLILMHAIGRPALQRGCLPLLKDAVQRGDLSPSRVAYLEDRIAFSERRPQKYGTQWDWGPDGRMHVWTLADPDRVNEFRAGLGLSPLTRLAYEPEGEEKGMAPADWEARMAEMEAWAKSVGWR